MKWLFRVETNWHATRFALVVTVFVVCVVALAEIALHPLDQWREQLRASWPVTTLITFVLTRFMGHKLLKINELIVVLKRAAHRDQLTDVATRDFFFARLAKQPKKPGVSLMVDIDHFKRVNDTYGHLVGDAVIAHVAKLLSQKTRRNDIVCRFGGEEFVVFLDNASADQAHVIAERVRRAVARARIEHDGQKVAVTVSIGVSTSAAAQDIEDAIREADAALYRAKAAGRNQTVMAGAVPAH